MIKVFLGGTVESDWRKALISMLIDVEYFDPIVDKWSEIAYKREEQAKQESDYKLYVITPKMKGAYSIAEAVDDSNKEPEKLVFCFLVKDEDSVFDSDQIKSLDKVSDMIQKNGGTVFTSLKELAAFLNHA